MADMNKFDKLTKEVQKWLYENCDPEYKITIDWSNIRLSKESIAYHNKDYGGK